MVMQTHNRKLGHTRLRLRRKSTHLQSFTPGGTFKHFNECFPIICIHVCLYFLKKFINYLYIILYVAFPQLTA